ncbi:putative acylamino-acid-releasing enzyme [Mycobacterium xenopi 4042]|uniref:Putative acylamino-acid-releasing enzyme n=1 Tax=Mycobacterium xenopi 4042 TaxID=1299334 RepID=X8AQ80_MYCXE|nr:putative acylamino-acid-releasing enzyme [Mycobacterium xenopi 4042]
MTWSSDGTSLIVTADQAGRTPVFVIDLSTSAITQLTTDDFAYTDVTPAPGGVLYALRSSLTAPHTRCESTPTAASQDCLALNCRRCQGLWKTSPRMHRTESRCVRGWCFLKTSRPRRCCSGFTGVRWPAGTAGRGGGIRG